MDLITAVVPILLTVSLAAVIFVVGLDADVSDLLWLFRRPAQLTKAILAVNVIPPIAAVLIVFLFPLSPVAKAGVLLMAISPMPPLVPGKQLKVGGPRSYAYGLYIALILLAVVIVPLTVAFFSYAYEVELSLPAVSIARNVALTVVAPLALGMLARRLAPTLAAKARPALAVLSNVLVLMAFVPLVIAVWPGIQSLIGNGTLAAMGLVSLIALLAGHLLGGPETANRSALAVASSTRHPGIAMMIANLNHADKAVTAAILAFMLVGIIVAIPYNLWLKRRSQRLEQPAAAAG